MWDYIHPLEQTDKRVEYVIPTPTELYLMYLLERNATYRYMKEYIALYGTSTATNRI